MTARRHHDHEPRKEPRQARSRQMRDRILDAALRVLHDGSALDFTTTRVAAEAQISVGSLYQYFPNKHALAVALHRRAITAGWDHVQAVLGDPRRSPRQKVIEIARWFFATESDDAASFGAVLDDLDVFLHDEATTDLELAVLDRFTNFLIDAGAQGAEDPQFGAQLLITTLESVGKATAKLHLTPKERDHFAMATATMVCSHLGLHNRPTTARRSSSAEPTPSSIDDSRSRRPR